MSSFENWSLSLSVIYFALRPFSTSRRTASTRSSAGSFCDAIHVSIELSIGKLKIVDSAVACCLLDATCAALFFSLSTKVRWRCVGSLILLSSPSPPAARNEAYPFAGNFY